MSYDVSITPGRVARHAPSSAQGREAALVDIAQDLLLRHLHDVGLLTELAFKGGTALRKLYAGNQGRFSLDLDFAVVNIGTDVETVVDLLAEEVTGLRIGPFDYGIRERRGKRILTMSSAWGASGTLESKLDVNPPPWLEPVTRGWVVMPIHGAYGGPLPALTVVRLEENVAEKVARLNRTTTARDVYDLVWLWRHFRHDGGLDAALVRRLAVLKIWVDKHGLSADGAHWKPGHDSVPFEADAWLRDRVPGEFDKEDIGQLAVPTPDLDELAKDLAAGYAFLRDLDADEQVVAAISATDRPTVLRMLAELPGGRLAGICY